MPPLLVSFNCERRNQRTRTTAEHWRWRGRRERSSLADQFSGASPPGDGKSPGIDRNARERARERRERGPGTLAPDPLAPSRRFPAFGKTHPIPVASRSRGRLSFFFFFMTAAGFSTRGSPIKSRLLLARHPGSPPSLPRRPSRPLLCGGNTIVLIAKT